MSDKPKTGRRVQVYLPADVLEWWEKVPRYERSKLAAAALRAWHESRLNIAESIAPAEKAGAGEKPNT